MSKTIEQMMPQRITHVQLDQEALDNGNWIPVINGVSIPGVSSVDPGEPTPKLEDVTSDHRKGADAYLRNYSDVESRVKIVYETDQLSVVRAVLGPQASVLAKTAANTANKIGDATKCASAPEQLAVGDLGHLILAPVSGTTTLTLEMLRQLRPDIDQTAGTFRFSIYNYTDHKFYDAAGTDLAGVLAWGANPYIGQVSVSGLTLPASVYSYDTSQAYGVTCSDGTAIAQIPEWYEKSNKISSGDQVVIVNCAYSYMQIAAAASADSYQISYPFDANERVFLELYRMMGDAPGGRGLRLKRRVYYLAKPVSVPTESTDGRDGTATKRTLEFITYPDVSPFGDGSHFNEQVVIYDA